MTRTHVQRFRNELGHDIYLRVTEEKDGSILIFLQGPDSDTEMEITRDEALALMDGLQKMLKPKRS